MNMKAATPFCACGQPLHYSDAKIESIMRRIVAVQGENIEIVVDGHRFSVQRHYIMLHGITGEQLLAGKVPGAKEVK